MKVRTLLITSLIFISLGSASPAQEQAGGEAWFMKTGKTSRGGYRLPVISGGLQTPTKALIKMKVETYPELRVSLAQASPFDLALKRKDLRANMLFDLPVLDLTNFPISTRLR